MINLPVYLKFFKELLNTLTRSIMVQSLKFDSKLMKWGGSYVIVVAPAIVRLLDAKRDEELSVTIRKK